jgi:hypothetical protein
MRLNRTRAFQKTLDELISQFPLSREEINAAVNDLPECWRRGARCPGYGFEVYKTRVPLKQYRLSAARGLRLMTLVMEEIGILVPLTIYKKGAFHKETDAIDWTRKKLREILRELRQD